MALAARTRSATAVVAVLVALWVATPASSALIDNGVSMIDTSTNLEWLELTVTLGQSINAALLAHPTYSLATNTQVAQMFTNGAGFSDLVAGALAIDAVPAQTLITLLGCTASAVVCAGQNAYGRGFAENTVAGSLYYAPEYKKSALNGGSGDAVVAQLLNNDPNASFADRGVFLVRVVPEPGTGVLVTLGLSGLALRRRG